MISKFGKDSNIKKIKFLKFYTFSFLDYNEIKKMIFIIQNLKYIFL